MALQTRAVRGRPRFGSPRAGQVFDQVTGGHGCKRIAGGGMSEKVHGLVHGVVERADEDGDVCHHQGSDL